MARVRKGQFRASDSNGCTIISTPYQLLTGKQLKQRRCCDVHDEYYWYGGSHQQRLHADRELRDCVLNLGQRKIGKICFWICGWVMYIAVRLGGTPKLPTPWRWRSNVPFELRDVKSGYRLEDIDLDTERELERQWVFATGDVGPDYDNKPND